MNRKKQLRKWMYCLVFCIGLGCLGGCGTKATISEPITLTIWTYYNGEQLACFNELVETFNETVGKEQQIVIESYSQGSVKDLELNLKYAAEGKVGADALPDMFSAYTDTVYFMDAQGLVADLRAYMTQEEMDTYVTEYMQEGDLDKNGSLKIFPVAKSTELLFLNDTDWQVFAKETGSSYEELQTLEGLIEVAKRYYEWTDAQTPQPDDGKAFYGRDAVANYMFAGAKEIEEDLFDVGEDGKITVQFKETTARKLWDCYYVPFIKGYFTASGRFRSDDMKTGNILAYVGSNSSASFFPKEVFDTDETSHEIEVKVMAFPGFADCTHYAIQQGAGIAVTKTTAEKMKASVLFLKWFTEAEHNVAFAVHSGYLPVKKEANSIEAVEQYAKQEITENVKKSLEAAFRTVQENALYVPNAFEHGSEIRNVLEYTLSDLAVKDRKVVEERIAQGMKGEEAVAEFLTDAYFQSWYQTLLSQLKAYEN